MERTQRYAFQKEKRTPVQTRVYCQFPGLLSIVGFLIGAFFFALIAQFKCGVRLLERVSLRNCSWLNYLFEITIPTDWEYFILKFPRVFSLGLASHEGPTKEEMNKTKFTFTLIGKGWSTSQEHHEEPPNKVKILKVRGTNPAYGATVTMFLQSALTILAESDRMPSKYVSY